MPFLSIFSSRNSNNNNSNNSSNNNNNFYCYNYKNSLNNGSNQNAIFLKTWSWILMRSFNKFRTIKSRTAVIYLCRARRAHLLKVLRAEEKKRIGVGAETSNYGSSHHRASFKAADRSNKPKNCQIVWPPARSRTRVFRNGASTSFIAAVVLKWLSLWPCLAQLRIFEDQEMVAAELQLIAQCYDFLKINLHAVFFLLKCIYSLRKARRQNK